MTAPVVLVTGAGGPLGVNFTRCLRESGAELRLIGTDANRWHLPLSLCDETYLIPAAADDRYAAALVEIIAMESVDAICPTHPVEVREVARLSETGELAVGTALPAVAVLDIADDKRATQELLAASGVPVPGSARVNSRADLEAAFDELVTTAGGVLWVRGAGAPGLGIGGAALPCRDVETAAAWVDHHDGWGKMAASEYLPGANLTWMALYAGGVLLAAAARERLEYVLPHVAPSGVTGAPAVSRTIGRDDVAEIGARAVLAIDPSPNGAYFVDLKEDASGAPRVTEINAGRCGTTVHFYSRAGCNFPWLLAQMALGSPPAPAPDPNALIESDLYWIRTLDCGPVLVRGDAGFDAYRRIGL